jgi:hypothetical protein
METNVTSQKKKSNLLIWILGGAALAAVVLFSSFTSSTSTSVGPCSGNANCLKGFWKWQIIKGWYQDTVTKAAANNRSVASQIEADAAWAITEKWTPDPADMQAWEAMVSNEMIRVMAVSTKLSAEDARYIAIENILKAL